MGGKPTDPSKKLNGTWNTSCKLPQRKNDLTGAHDPVLPQPNLFLGTGETVQKTITEINVTWAHHFLAVVDTFFFCIISPLGKLN